MREIVLDTETTGLDPNTGHRIIEIGCVELINHLPTGREWTQFLNPERPLDPAATAVHGITDAMLAGKPVFAEIVEDFLTFLGDAPLVIHNASFDIGFLNAELKRVGFATLPLKRALDTVAMARQKFPGSPASLDALCKRFGIDLATREKHGALIDARLLAEVYLELLGGRQATLTLAPQSPASQTLASQTLAQAAVRGMTRGTAQSPADMARMAAQNADPENLPAARPARPHAASDEEKAAHAAFLKTLDDPLWVKLSKVE